MDNKKITKITKDWLALPNKKRKKEEFSNLISILPDKYENFVSEEYDISKFNLIKWSNDIKRPKYKKMRKIVKSLFHKSIRLSCVTNQE